MQKKNIRLYGVLNHFIDEVWPSVKPILKKAVDYSDGKYLVDDIYDALKQRNMQLWLVFDDQGLRTCCVTQIINYPRKKIMQLLFIAGNDHKDWLHFADDLKNFAKDLGCQAVEGWGRPGWEKSVKEVGFKKIHTIYRQTITEQGDKQCST